MNQQYELIANHFKTSADLFHTSLSLVAEISRAADLSVDCLRNSGKVLWCGNGGSAADSQHLAAELMGRYKRNRNAIPSIALTTDTSILTAISNDFGYENVFSRQVQGLGQANDLLFALTTSGRSQSILNAVAEARRKKMKTVLLTSTSYFGNDADVLIRVDSQKTEHIQHLHIAIGHIICEIIERKLSENE